MGSSIHKITKYARETSIWLSIHQNQPANAIRKIYCFYYVYFEFPTIFSVVFPLAYKNTPFPKQYTILSNKWGAVHGGAPFLFHYLFVHSGI